MQKRVEVTVSPDRTDELIGLIQELDGVTGLQVERGISLRPPGDSVTAVLSSRSLHRLMRELHERRIGFSDGSSISTSDLASVITPKSREGIGRETSDLSWEEIEVEMGKESNMTSNALLLMATSGAVTAAGIATSTLHLVLGAMIIAPGFEPISRIALGVVTRGEAWYRGVKDVLKGYAALVAGAVLASLLLLLSGKPLGGESTYLAPGALVSYWTTITAPGVLVSALAGAAGAILIASGRSVLTAGVLVTLALVPTATLVGMTLVAGDFPLLGRSLLRWLIDVALVAGMGIPVFLRHGSRLERRRSML